MRNIQIQQAKLKRLIDLHGVEYTFYRDEKTDLGEPNGSASEVVTLRGIWHESQGYIQTASGDAATVRSKPQVQILALFDSKGDLSQGDYLMRGMTQYKVTGTHDLTNLGVALDISLEEVV